MSINLQRGCDIPRQRSLTPAAVGNIGLRCIGIGVVEENTQNRQHQLTLDMFNQSALKVFTSLCQWHKTSVVIHKRSEPSALASERKSLLHNGFSNLVSLLSNQAARIPVVPDCLTGRHPSLSPEPYMPPHLTCSSRSGHYCSMVPEKHTALLPLL